MRTNKQILIIDDELGIRETITDILEEEGYSVFSSENGMDALAEIEHHFFNVAIIDINLPDINGLEVLKRMKCMNGDTYAIMLTASTAIENSIQALNDGAYAYIVKPFDVDALKETIRKAISEQNLALENKRLLFELKRTNDALLKANTEVEALNRELESKIEERTGELKKQMTWTSAIIESLADGLCTIDSDWHITLFNHQAEIITGYKSEEAIGKSLNEIFRSKCHDCIALIQKSIQKGEKSANIEVYIENKEGQRIPLLISTAPIIDKKTEILGVVQNFRDISEQKQLQEQLIQTSKLASMGELMANFTHEIKNPLNGMILFATLIKSEADPKSETYNYAERILDEGTRIGKITTDILSFSRQEGREYDYEEIIPVIESTLSLTERQLNLDGILVERDFSDNLPKIRINPNRIGQVLLNLINNAQYSLNEKYGKNGRRGIKRVSVRAKNVTIQEKSWVRLEIEDNGLGISPKHQKKIFDPFFTTKSVGNGTGLGLSVSYGIIKDHYGEIQVESQEQKYTKFIINLPAFEMQVIAS